MKASLAPQRLAARRGFMFFALAHALLLTAALFAPGAHAQSTSGRLTGVVMDSGGNPVGAGYVVKLTSERKGDSAEATTSAEGDFSFSWMEPGTYMIAVVGPTGTAERLLNDPPTVLVQVNQRGFFKIALAAATTEAIVSAPGEPPSTTMPPQAPAPGGRATRQQRRKPVGQVRTATQGSTFTEGDIDRSPDSNQRFSRLTQQTPGAVDSGGGGSSSLNTAFSGQRREQNVLLVDGADLTSPVKLFQSTSGEQEGISPYRIERTIGNIQEFRVASNTYEADFGTGSGAQIIAITKTGDKVFRGTLFENFRNRALNARNFFDTEEPPFQQNVFGVRVGGPLYLRKDGEASTAVHTFYAGYEGARARPGYEIFEAVPSAAARARAVPSIRPVLDAFVSPAATVIPGAATPGSDFDVVRLVSKGTTENNAFDLRFDFTLMDNDDEDKKSTLNVRFLTERPTTFTPEGVSGRQQVIRDTTYNFLVSNVHKFSAKTTNEFRFYTNLFRNNLRRAPPHGRRGPLTPRHRPLRQRPLFGLAPAPGAARAGRRGRPAPPERERLRRQPLLLPAQDLRLHRAGDARVGHQHAARRRRIPPPAHRDRPAQRHDLHLRHARRPAPEPPPVGAVQRRPRRAQPLRRWHGPRARGEAGVLHRLHTGRVEAARRFRAQRRAALRVLQRRPRAPRPQRHHRPCDRRGAAHRHALLQVAAQQLHAARGLRLGARGQVGGVGSRQHLPVHPPRQFRHPHRAQKLPRPDSAHRERPHQLHARRRLLPGRRRRAEGGLLRGPEQAVPAVPLRARLQRLRPHLQVRGLVRARPWRQPEPDPERPGQAHRRLRRQRQPATPRAQLHQSRRRGEHQRRPDQGGLRAARVRHGVVRRDAAPALRRA